MKIINRLLTPLGFDLNQSSGLLDFATGIILVIMPWFYVQEGNIRSLATMMAIGAAFILYSIFTDYRYGIIKFIALKIHEALDLTISVTMMALFPLK
jgi:hypothetical protein